MSSSVRIRIVLSDLGWVAMDEDAEISSQPMPTMEGALGDLDENLALDSCDLELRRRPSRVSKTASANGVRGGRFPTPR